MEFQHILSKGAFGVVYGVGTNPLCSAVAIKASSNSAKAREHIENEAQVYGKLMNYPNYDMFFPTIYAVCTFGFTFIAMERFDTTLEAYLSLNCIEKHVRHGLIARILAALEFLHARNLTHGDIKTSNILVNVRGTEISSLKLSDFGAAAALDVSGRAAAKRGTVLFMSEDAHMGRVLSRRSDLENLGWVLIHSFFRGTLPWKTHRSSKHVLREKIKTKSAIQENGAFQFILDQSTKRLDLYFKHVLSLVYTQCPNYSMLIDLFS